MRAVCTVAHRGGLDHPPLQTASPLFSMIEEEEEEEEIE